MALFNRNKTDQTGMPAEVQNYYQAENRERTGMAWLLALGTLLVTVLVVLGLFYGGRWSYNKLRKSDKPNTVAVQTDKPTENTTSTPTNPEATTPQTSSDTTPTTSSPNPSSSSDTPTVTNPQTGDSDLPNTGPGDTFAVFVAVSVLAYLAHRRFLVKT